MAKIYDFVDLRIYQEAVSLDEKIWALREVTYEIDRSTWWQISRSVASGADNIAEGFNRGSRREYKTFLGYSLGSAGEVRSQLMRMKRRGYLEETYANHLIDRCARLERSIKNTLLNIRDNVNPGFRHSPATSHAPTTNSFQEPKMIYGSPMNIASIDEDELPF